MNLSGANMTEQQQRQFQLEALCGNVFGPSAPINKLSLFAGRLVQMGKLRDAINSRGCHAILFGDRGVGKTSLASILKELFAKIPSMQIVKTNCVESDDFQNAWRKALSEITIVIESPNPEGEIRGPEQYTLDQYMPNYPLIGPGEIRHLLKWASETQDLVIV